VSTRRGQLPDEKELKRGISRVRQSGRLYALVRHIQKLSDGAIPLTFFDDKRQALIDLDDAYEPLKDSDPDGAERVRNARIAGILVGNFYRDLRRIDANTTVNYLLPALEAKEGLGDDVDGLTYSEPDATSDGDADLLVGDDDDQAREPDFLPLVTLIAKSHGQQEIVLPSGKSLTRDEVVAEVAESVEEAAEEAQSTSRASRNITGPIKQLEEAVKKARAAAEGYQQFHAAEGFNAKKFEYHLKKLKTNVTALENLIEQHGS